MNGGAATSPTRAQGWDFLSGHVIRRHRHAEGQLEYASSGVMTVTTAAGRWIVPPQRALWIPPMVEHEVRMRGDVAMRTVYVHPRRACTLPGVCRVVAVSPLLRELIVRAVATPQPYGRSGPGARLFAVLLDEIAAAPSMPLHLPMPRDGRLRVLAEALTADPSDGSTVEHLAAGMNVSGRTLERMFLRETEMTLGAWRQHLRLMEAMRLLAVGESVTDVALAVGYESTSAFISMFRRATGRSPARYFQDD